MLLGFLLGILVTLIIAVFVSPYLPQIPFLAKVQSNLSIIQAVGSLAIACSALVAFFVYRSTVKLHAEEDRRKASEKYLQESIRLIERAYAIFTDSGHYADPPRNDRLTWLSTARMIIRFKKMRSKISVSEHIVIADEQEEYWRLQFYSLLRENRENLNLSYFQPSGDRYGADTVARKSVAIIFDFAKWKETETDPLDEIDDKELLANGAIPLDYNGVESFLEQYEEYWRDVLKIREQRNSSS